MFSFMEGQVTPEAFGDVDDYHYAQPSRSRGCGRIEKDCNPATVITNSETKDVFTKEGIEAIVLDEGSYQSKDFTIRA